MEEIKQFALNNLKTAYQGYYCYLSDDDINAESILSYYDGLYHAYKEICLKLGISQDEIDIMLNTAILELER